MSGGLEEFGKVAGRLARNPLGIIALFIVLVYGIAGLVTTSFGPSASAPIQIVLTIFVVGFPVLVLGTFYRLVTHHHTKLYAPEDFREEENFMRVASPKDAKVKRVKEASEYLAAADEMSRKLGDRMETMQRSISADEYRQRLTSAKDKISEIEKTALQVLEATFENKVQRHVVIGSGENKIFFDAVVENENLPGFEESVKQVFFEIKLAPLQSKADIPSAVQIYKKAAEKIQQQLRAILQSQGEPLEEYGVAYWVIVDASANLYKLLMKELKSVLGDINYEPEISFWAGELKSMREDMRNIKSES